MSCTWFVSSRAFFGSRRIVDVIVSGMVSFNNCRVAAVIRVRRSQYSRSEGRRFLVDCLNRGRQQQEDESDHVAAHACHLQFVRTNFCSISLKLIQF
ncbi:hypothetical protein WR25_06255 [Diploscapter pachys]|uniref:Uncharacterized protein n=1 Tax=Diploscapter pachys TaxID=2018661 RepID=A0A2A2LX68_9BILA|nr:hypothetical protein WR25_06255 [Diploscapter pachys]